MYYPPLTDEAKNMVTCSGTHSQSVVELKFKPGSFYSRGQWLNLLIRLPSRAELLPQQNILLLKGVSGPEAA